MRGIALAYPVDEGGQALGQLGVVQLEHVLGVLLAGAGEVEGAGEDPVVGDGDLGVHEVVHRLGSPARRRLAPEVGVLEGRKP
jgi:hypothetical protein